MEWSVFYLGTDVSVDVLDVGGRNMERKSWKPIIFHFFFFFFSKGIADYITRCQQAIGKFESLVHQIHKNADDISTRLALIESINLFKYPAPISDKELPGRSDFLFLWLWKEWKNSCHDCAQAWACEHTHTHTCTLNGIKPFLMISVIFLKGSWVILTFCHVPCIAWIILQISESVRISSTLINNFITRLKHIVFLWAHAYLFKPDILSRLRLVNKQCKESKFAEKWKSRLPCGANFSRQNGHSHALIYFCLGCFLTSGVGLFSALSQG